MAAPIPIIVCGAKQAVAIQVKSNMQPEYDVVYAGFDLAASAKEVPQIIAGAAPPADSLHTQLGSNDFTTAFPRAVVTGGGYNDEAFHTLFRACADACGSDDAVPVPFFRVDNSITSRLEAEGKGPVMGGPGYPEAIAKRLKDCLREAGVEGPDAEEGKLQNGGKQFMF